DDEMAADGPCINNTSYYLAGSGPDQELTVDIPSPVSSEVFHFRVVCRPMVELATHAAGVRAEVTCEFVAASGTVVGRVAQELYSEVSPHARFNAPFLSGFAPCRPVYFHVAAPPDAVIARFNADVPVLLAFYSRGPAEENEFTMVPEFYMDRSAFSLETEKQRAWFYFRPMEHRDLRADGRVWVVSLPCGVSERSPVDPEEREEILDRATSWHTETVYPEGLVPRHVIFEQYERPVLGRFDEDEAAAPEAWDRNIFFQLPVHEEIEILADATGVPGTARLRILYELAADATPWLDIRLDGAPWRRVPVFEPSGVVLLEELPAGRHGLMITTPGMFFVEHEPAVPTAVYRRRTVSRITAASPLTVVVEKPDMSPKILNVLAYPRPLPGMDRLDLRVTIAPEPRIETGLMFRRKTRLPRQFSIRVEALNDPAERLFSAVTRAVGHHLVVPLFEDMPAGRYRLKFSVPRGQEAYLRFFTLRETAAVSDAIRFYRERGEAW
ncbi:hypothetical protein JW905_17820, partial [bacterium]|nr:hypothetical protein [candidate division CSSED10-310 bacterium]